LGVEIDTGNEPKSSKDEGRYSDRLKVVGDARCVQHLHFDGATGRNDGWPRGERNEVEQMKMKRSGCEEPVEGNALGNLSTGSATVDSRYLLLGICNPHVDSAMYMSHVPINAGSGDVASSFTACLIYPVEG
jgi:hypothetical protein